jgi:hypothetical protein
MPGAEQKICDPQPTRLVSPLIANYSSLQESESVWASLTGERDGRVAGSIHRAAVATRRLFLWHGSISGLLRRWAIETYQFTCALITNSYG